MQGMALAWDVFLWDVGDGGDVWGRSGALPRTPQGATWPLDPLFMDLPATLVAGHHVLRILLIFGMKPFGKGVYLLNP